MNRENFKSMTAECGVGAALKMPDGRVVRVVDANAAVACEGCFFGNNCREVNGVGCGDACCTPSARTDGKSVVFVEVKNVKR